MKDIRSNNNFLVLSDLNQQVTLDVPPTVRKEIADNREELNGNTDEKRRSLTISPPAVTPNDKDNIPDSSKQVGKDIKYKSKYVTTY